LLGLSTGVGQRRLRADSTADLIAQGDNFDPETSGCRSASVLSARRKGPTEQRDPAARIARQYRYLMADATSPDEKLRLGRIALTTRNGRRRLLPTIPRRNFSVAISYGKMLPSSAQREQLEASSRIKDSADKAIMLDSRNDLCLARSRSLAPGSLMNTSKEGWPLSTSTVRFRAPSIEESVRCFEMAIEINPHRLMHYIKLGRAYAQMGRTAEARA
jgi:hypothetical protein